MSIDLSGIIIDLLSLIYQLGLNMSDFDFMKQVKFDPY